MANFAREITLNEDDMRKAIAAHINSSKLELGGQVIEITEKDVRFKFVTSGMSSSNGRYPYDGELATEIKLPDHKITF